MSDNGCGEKPEIEIARLHGRVNVERDARMALDRLMESKFIAAQLAVDKALVEVKGAHDILAGSTAEKFQSHNEFRLQIREERVEYVTKAEIRWLIGTVITLTFAIIGLFVTRLR